MIEEFRDDDRAYLDWLGSNDGYVINIQRSLNPSTARLHNTSCRTIRGQPPRGGPWTGPYIKLCSPSLADLDAWALQQVGTSIRRCGICQPPGPRGGLAEPRRPDRPRPLVQPTDAVRAEAAGFEVRGPLAGRPVIEAWTDDYVRFERRPPEQEALRDELRARLRRLDARPAEVLHATYLGPKHPTADVENLALYNIDDSGACFASAARRGLRFEHAPRCGRSPTGREYRYGYRYALVPGEAGFEHWLPGRRYADWDWVDLGRFGAEKRLEQVWLALRCTAIEVASPPRQPRTPFAVHVTVRPPRGRLAVLGYLVKSIFDGVVAAFQAHEDAASVGEVSARVAKTVSASPQQVEALLLDQGQAVLGVTDRLLHERGAGVQWTPADDLCVGGELLAEEPVDERWSIRGRLTELRRA